MSTLDIIRDIIVKNIKDEMFGLSVSEKIIIIDALKNDINHLRIKFEGEILKLQNNDRKKEESV